MNKFIASIATVGMSLASGCGTDTTSDRSRDLPAASSEPTSEMDFLREIYRADWENMGKRVTPLKED